jgi:ectoine hydroxylase-related dioxygenase (phytanoyl-CoA dioxygenase family)
MAIETFNCGDVENDADARARFERAYARDGAAVVTGVLAAGETDAMRAGASHFAEVRADGERPHAPYHHMHKVEPAFAKAVRQPRLVALADFLAGSRVVALQALFYYKPPGYKGFSRHQDNFFVRSDPPDALVVAWVAVDDADAENGCLSVYPRSHRLPILDVRPGDPSSGSSQSKTVHEHYGDVTVPEGYERVLVPLEEGGVLFMHGNTVHESADNVSAGRFRRSVVIDYLAAGAGFRPGESAKRTPFAVR